MIDRRRTLIGLGGLLILLAFVGYGIFGTHPNPPEVYTPPAAPASVYHDGYGVCGLIDTYGIAKTVDYLIWSTELGGTAVGKIVAEAVLNSCPEHLEALREWSDGK